MVDANDPSVMVIDNKGPNYAGINPPSAAAIQVGWGMAFVTDFNRMDGTTTLVLFDINDPANIAYLNSFEIQVNDGVIVDGDRLVIVGNGRIEVRYLDEPETVRGQAVTDRRQLLKQSGCPQ